MQRDDLVKRLLALDEEVDLMYPGPDRIRMVIVGGGALVLMEYLSHAAPMTLMCSLFPIRSRI